MTTHIVRNGTGWDISSNEVLTDEQAAGIEFDAMPSDVVLGGFVRVIDPEGERIGHVKSGVYIRQPLARSRARVTIELL